MAGKISCDELAAVMRSDSLFAVLDVRERGEFDSGHIPNATSLPRSQIEFRIATLVPDVKIPISIYDEGAARSELAARTLTELGYSRTSVLQGGLSAWKQEGLPVVSGVNVPSKAFGEKIHREEGPPEMTAEELKALQAKAANLVVVDVRTPEEYRRFCIPDAINVPGGDLILWAEEFKQKPDRMIVVNCAGRTRSIVGTAALRRLGLKNVRALKNGTMGWVLAGFELESKPLRAAPAVSDKSREQARALALRVAEDEKIPLISARDVLEISARRAETVSYIIDVRSEREYEAGHIPGSIALPGGQAVQRADDFIAVRNETIVFISNRGSRAVMAAYWYRRMGFRAAGVLLGGLEAWRADGGSVITGECESQPLGLERARQGARLLGPTEVNSLCKTSHLMILDVGSSLEYQAAHMSGAKWISRGWLESKLPAQVTDKSVSILLSCRDGAGSTFAARSLKGLGYQNVFVLSGGIKAWLGAGFSAESGAGIYLTEPNDVVLSPSIRGSKEEMQRYLDWELSLA